MPRPLAPNINIIGEFSECLINLCVAAKARRLSCLKTSNLFSLFACSL